MKSKESVTEKVAHTPGPWSTGGIFNPGTDHETTSIWGPRPVGAQSGEWIAKDVALPNARLIAAALALLKACHGALVRLVSVSDFSDPRSEASQLQVTLRAAIAKAEQP